VQEFTKLKVWQKAHALTIGVYTATSGYPKEEQFGVANQLRRAATSISANIAEGCGRGSDPDFARFLQIALGSAFELQYFLLLSKDLGYLPVERAQGEFGYSALTDATVEVKRMLTALIQRLKSSN
jgi:four helix bundle protein